MNVDLKALSPMIMSGDKTAFSAFFKHHFRRYVIFALRYVSSESTAKDLVQESFVSLWDTREKVGVVSNLDSYMYSIVRNKCLNHIRDYSSKMEYVDQFQDEIDETKTERMEEESECKKRTLRTWITNLPERQRDCLILSRYEGLDHHEIASVLNISVRTVNNHIVAAVKSLQARFETKKTSREAI